MVKPNILSLIVARLITVTTLLAAAVIIQLSTAVFLPLGPFYLLVLFSYATCLFFLVLYKTDAHYRAQAVGQIMVDLLVVTILVYITGGLGGHLFVLYIFPILAAGLLLPGRAAYLMASLAAILFGALVDGMYYGLIPFYKADQYHEASLGLILYTIFLAWGLFFAIAALFDLFGRRALRARLALDEVQRELNIKERLAEAGQMSALIAHEIRNPLTAISGAVQVLKSELKPSGGAAELMEIVLRESRRVSQTIEQFLNLASPAPREFQKFRLSEIIGETLTLLRMSGDLDARFDVGGNYEDSPLEFYGSPGQFKQVVWNLARNAIQAMPEGGSLRIECARDGIRGLMLRIADTGRGMSAEEQERMFEPFFTTSPGGRGLGLAVVRRIVEDYAGTIEVRSEPGRGTAFLLSLPERPAPDLRKEA